MCNKDITGISSKKLEEYITSLILDSYDKRIEKLEEEIAFLKKQSNNRQNFKFKKRRI